ARQAVAVEDHGFLLAHALSPLMAADCSSSTRRDVVNSSRATSNCSLRHMSLTVTVLFASSFSPCTSTKRMPARSAYLNCLPSLAPSNATSVAIPAARSSAARARQDGNCASSICVTSTCTVLDSDAPIRPASRNCQYSRVAPMEIPTPGNFDLVYWLARLS